MTKKTAMVIGFLLTTSSLIVMIVFLMIKDTGNGKPMLFLGLGLALGSLVLRSLLRYKPDWFKDSDIEEKK